MKEIIIQFHLLVVGFAHSQLSGFSKFLVLVNNIISQRVIYKEDNSLFPKHFYLKRVRLFSPGADSLYTNGIM